VSGERGEAQLNVGRQLLVDQTIAMTDCVAGPFTLFYAQPLATIVRLTSEHVIH
jgi:hypothetical protein